MFGLRLLLALLVSLILPNQSIAQKEKTHWFFGEGAGLDFSSGQPKVTKNVPTWFKNADEIAVVSDPLTGKLVLVTNGKEVFDANLKSYDSPLFDQEVHDVQLLSIEPGKEYLVLCQAYNGTKQSFIAFRVYITGNTLKMSGHELIYDDLYLVNTAAVRNCRKGGYWFMGYDYLNAQFLTFGISKTGIIKKEPRVFHPTNSNIFHTHFISNTQGTLLAAIESHETGQVRDNKIGLYTVDKECGSILTYEGLAVSTEEKPLALAFSENGDYLYVSFFRRSSKFGYIVQYDLSDFSQQVIAENLHQMNDMELGPDGKIYVTAAKDVVEDSKWLHTIHKPNEKGQNCQFQAKAIYLGDNTYARFDFPNFMQDFTTNTCSDRCAEFSINDACIGEKLQVKLLSDFFPDEWTWTLNGKDTLTQKLPELTPSTAGNYEFKFKYQVCPEPDSVVLNARVGSIADFDLGPDTTLCHGDSLHITIADIENAQVEWLPRELGDSSTVNLVKEGFYKVTVKDGNCLRQDSIQLTVHPSIWVDLGKEYFICDDLDDMVILDAGKGFEKYLWHPTGDSTRWLEVTLVDSYYVIVDDYRGCKGGDGTQVKRLCPSRLFFPNAFSPNADGLNDEFGPVGQDILKYHLQIYNRWGERIFETYDVHHTWDGTFKEKESPVGQYLWKCNYIGYKSKTAKELRSVSGAVYLVK